MNKLKFGILSFLVLFNYCSETSKVSYGIKTFPKNLDPSFGLDFDESQISSQIYENLISLDDDCKTLKPQLALNWTISEDKCKYTFILRNNVFFHDGTKLTSNSIVRSFEWLGKKDIRSEIYDQIKSVNVIDSLTFQFILYKPYSIFLYVLASPESFQIMSENAITKYDTLIGRHPVGTGPYYLYEWVDGDKIILHKFNEYWDEQGEINEIVFKYYLNTFQGEDYLEKNIIDILYSATSYSIDRLKWTGFIDYYIFVPVGIQFIGFNNNVYPFNIKDFRKAILKAINIPKFVHSTNRGKAIVAKGPLPPNYYVYNKVQESYEIDEAKKILHELGFNSLNITFDYPKIAFARTTKIEFLKHELEKVGIHLKLHAHDSWDDLDKVVSSDSAQMFYYGGRSDIIGDPYNFLWGFFYSKSEFNTLKYKDSIIDRWIDEAIQENDPKKRQGLYRKIVSKILDDTPAIFLFHIIPSLAYNTKKIKKLIANPYGTVQFNKIVLN